MLYRFQIELSDVDRGIYQTLDFRVSQHPSESLPYLLTRTLAFAHSFQEGLEFSPQGLGDPEAPALRSTGLHGVIGNWIEIGNPSAKKLHRASKAAKQVIVYTYKDPEVLKTEIENNQVHRAQDLQIYAFESRFLQNLEKHLEKNNRWSILVQQGRVDVGIGETTISGDVRKITIGA